MVDSYNIISINTGITEEDYLSYRKKSDILDMPDTGITAKDLGEEETPELPPVHWKEAGKLALATKIGLPAHWIGLDIDAEKLEESLPGLADIAGFGIKYLTPEGREQFKKMSGKQKAKDIAWQSIDPVLIALGIKYGKAGVSLGGRVWKGIKKGGGLTFEKLGLRLPTKPIKNPFDKEIMKKVLEAEPKKTISEALTDKFKISIPDAVAIEEKRYSDILKSSDVFKKKLLTEDGERLTKKTIKVIKEHNALPMNKILKDNIKKYNDLVKNKYNIDASPSRVARIQIARLYPEIKETANLKNLSNDELGNLIYDLIKHPGAIKRKLDIASFFPYLSPVRKVLGKMQDAWGTKANLYDRVSEIFESKNIAAINYSQRWQSFLVDHGLASYKKSAKKIYAAGRQVEARNVSLKFTQQEIREAGQALIRRGNLKKAQKAQGEVDAIINRLSPNAKKLVRAYDNFTDHMYGDYMWQKIALVFDEAGMNTAGRIGTKDFVRDVIKRIDRILGEGSDLKYLEKADRLNGILSDAGKLADTNPNWFTAKGDDFIKVLSKLKKDLTMRGPKGGNFIHYVEDYASRIDLKDATNALGRMPEGSRAHAAFTKQRRRAEAENVTDDLIEMVKRRVNAQSKELYMYPYEPKLRKFASKYPERLKAYTNHYLNRMMGIASEWDAKVAGFLNERAEGLFNIADRLHVPFVRGSRAMQRAEMGDEMFTPQMIQSFAWRINDLMYTGALGLKPFSAMRNLFQPLLNVPTDLGGVKDVRWLLRGYQKFMFDPKARTYLKEIGAITQYSPDVVFRVGIKAPGKGLKLGKKVLHLPTWQEFREFNMWAFKGSDELNRFVTGGAAMGKWESLTAKYGEKIFGTGTTLSKKKRAILDFKNKINLKGRDKWVRGTIENALDTGTVEGFNDAKKIFIKDVVADTQYLYSATDTPLVTHAGGILGKSGLIFQSWWMNYGSLWGKWVRNAETVPEAMGKMFAHAVTCRLAYEAMQKMWGTPAAERSVGLGVFPGMSGEVNVPAPLDPIWNAARLVKTAASLDYEKVPDRIHALLRSGLMFVPGGQQMYYSTRGAIEKGPEGFARSIVRWRKEEEERRKGKTRGGPRK